MEEKIQSRSKIPFKVSARTAKLIGLENFSNEEGAIIELVKNTYDADAKNCILVFDLKYTVSFDENNEEIKAVDKYNSRIFVIDNGIGMTDKIISNQWMTIGTDNKLNENLSKHGRVRTGAKGIGRFALNRLGLNTDLLTVSEDTKSGLEWKVNWKDFDRLGATVSEIEADLELLSNLEIKKELLRQFSNHDRLIEMISHTTFVSGTIIEISELNDNWSIEQIEKLFRNLEMLLPPNEQSDFNINLFSTDDIELFGKVNTAYYDDFDYKVETFYTDILST